jgi:hypothetical protein
MPTATVRVRCALMMIALPVLAPGALAWAQTTAAKPADTAPAPSSPAQPAAARTTSAQPAPAPGASPAPASAASSDQLALPKLLQSMTPAEQAYTQHLITLTNPYFEGRAPGLAGNQRAAEYVEFHLTKLGLLPAFPKTDKAADGSEKATPRASYRQTFAAGSETFVSREVFTIAPPGGGAGVTLSPGKDFNVLSIAGNAQAEGEVVFVGYAINDGPDNYNTFAEGDDLTGKIAMVLRFEPKNEQGKSRWNPEGGWSPAAGLAPKLQRIAQRGAAGVILVNPPGADDPRVNQLEDVRSMRRPGPALSVPVVMMSTAQAANLAGLAGKDLNTLTRGADDRGGITPLTGPKVTLATGLERRTIDADNVGAVLPGRGNLADQFVIIGAHMDHLGYGASGSRDANPAGKLHPGADDNASGTSGLLLAAAKLAEHYKSLPADANARSVLFLGFNAEESGLIGSRYFVRNSPLPASAAYVMLNMDMIGRLRDSKLEVSGVGTAEGFADLLKPFFDASGITVRTLPGGQGPSDHASFYAAEVPVLHFFTGLSREYHMPTDLYPTINYRGAVQVVDLVVNVAKAMGTRAEPLVFTRASGPSVNLTNPDEPAPPGGPGARRDPGASGPGMGGVRVRFGISPGSYSDDKPGIEIGEVFPNTTAAEIGLKAGDRMIKWNTSALTNVESWMSSLAQAKPGDEVEITWIREGQQMTGKGKLKARDRGDR